MPDGSRNRSKTQAETIACLENALESLQDAHQAMISKAELLEQQNYILRKKLDKISDDLINAAGLSLGRMLIEAGLAVKELRDHMPAEPAIHEKNLEEGELIDPAMSIWRARLDRMILRISEAHTKAKDETQEVADTISGMVKEMCRYEDAIQQLDPSPRRSKRIRELSEVDYECEDGYDEEDDPEYSIDRKRARLGESTFQPESAALRPFLAPAGPIISSDIHVQQCRFDGNGVLDIGSAKLGHIPPVTTNQYDSPLSNYSLQAVLDPTSWEDIETNVTGGNMGMHADRRKLMQKVKVEADESKFSAVSHRAKVTVPRKWRQPFSLMNINQEEAEWLMKPKNSWTQGGWTNKLDWLQAVIGEYRRIKKTASLPEEAESDLRVLVTRINRGNFLPSVPRV